MNDHVRELAGGLAALAAQGRGPAPLVIAPSLSATALVDSRRALRQLVQGEPADQVLRAARLQDADGFAVLAVSLPLVGRNSVAMRSNMRAIFERCELDVVHVHDPLESELSRSAVRLWPGLTAATFHDVRTGNLLQALTQPLRQRLLDAIDLRLAPHSQDIERLSGLLGGGAREVVAIDDLARPELPTAALPPRDSIVIGRGDHDDAVVVSALRALAPIAQTFDLEVALITRWARRHRPATPRPLRGRMHSVTARSRSEADQLLVHACCYVSLPGTHPRARAEAEAAGAPIVNWDGLCDLRPEVEQVLMDQPDEPASAHTLPTREQLASRHIELMHGLLARRRPRHPGPPPAERSCVIDLHMHTSHSWDCATDPEALLFVAKKVGLTAIAVTDHNEVSGALVCSQLADEYGLQVIVGEEIKTSEGEVIGLFLNERIEPGLSWQETISRIRQQDGVVYVPHPFDRLHTIPDSATLRDSVPEIDLLEVYNARLAFEQYNDDALRFARKYNLLQGAGSDAHVVQGLGTAAVHMPAWDDPESFLIALGQGEIVRRPKSLLYLQGLKLMHSRAARSSGAQSA